MGQSSEKKPPAGEITAKISSWRNGEPDAYEELLALVMAELRKMAQAFLRNEKPNVMMQTTVLLNDVCVELGLSEPRWENRRQFFGFAGYLLRKLLINYSRHDNAEKRGRDFDVVSFMDVPEIFEREDLNRETLITLNMLLDRLEAFDPEGRELVELRFTFGYSNPEIAKALGRSEATVKRKWRVVSSWLASEFGTPHEKESSRAVGDSTGGNGQ